MRDSRLVAAIGLTESRRGIEMHLCILSKKVKKSHFWDSLLFDALQVLYISAKERLPSKTRGLVYRGTFRHTLLAVRHLSQKIERIRTSLHRRQEPVSVITFLTAQH